MGGGQGRFLVAAGQRTPGLKLMLFDLPAVVALGHARPSRPSAWATAPRSMAATSPAIRCPPGADIASLVRVLYDHGDERALAILRAVHRALPPGGTLLVAEPMAGAPGAPRMGDAYFGMYLLAMRGGRAAHRRRADGAAAHGRLRAGARTAPRPIPLQVGVLVCRRGVAGD